MFIDRILRSESVAIFGLRLLPQVLMPIPDVVYESFGPVAVLLAVIRDVLSLALVSKRVRSSIPPITEITIGPKSRRAAAKRSCVR